MTKQITPRDSAIADDDIYTFSPLYRLRDSKNGVLVCGTQGLPLINVHKSAGIVLALCNGKRSVSDIARLTRPLVKVKDDFAAFGKAKDHVKFIIANMSMTEQERGGNLNEPNEYAAPAVLNSKAKHQLVFGNTSFKLPTYSPAQFLPKDSSDLRYSAIHNEREVTPVGIVWHLTSECSTDCKYCYLGRRMVKPLPAERASALIEEAAAIGVLRLHLGGGDILLYPHLDEVLGTMQKHTFLPISFSTKTFLSKQKAEMIANYSGIIKDLQFSIDSTVSDVADYMVGAKGYLGRTLQSIKNALEAGIRVDAKAVITPYNILTIPKLYRDLKEVGVSVIRLTTYHRSRFHHTDDMFNNAISYNWLIDQMQSLRSEFPEDPIYVQDGPPELAPKSILEKEKAWQNRSACTAGRTGMMICTDGKVIPCEQMPETEEYFCGDVSYQSIEEVWNSDRLKELTYGIEANRFKDRPCFDCEQREKCLHAIGICIRNLAMFHGSIYNPDINCPKSDLPFIRNS
jgi:radical SAM protein with 4Fe4S-binding SPASM domain